MKYLFVFLLTFLLGILGVVSYGILKKSPGKPIQNIIQTVTKPEFTIDKAPSESVNGNILSITGNVNWEDRTATESSPITSPSPTIQQGEEIDTLDTGQVSVEFPNAINITVAPKTQIDFVQTLPASFVASIASGSAEFKKLGSTPVSVRALHLLLKQNNGDTIVSVDNDNSLINLNILAGSIIAAYNDTNLVSHEMEFNAPQQIVFNDLTRTFGL